jgi:hypothetical protein
MLITAYMNVSKAIQNSEEISDITITDKFKLTTGNHLVGKN